MSNHFLLSLYFFVCTLSASHVQADPPGYEFVAIPFNPVPNRGIQAARINDCGEIVFSHGYFHQTMSSQAEVYLFDNGNLTQLTNNVVRDGLPDINNDGVIVWHRLGIENIPEIIKRENGIEVFVTFGFNQKINNQGAIVFTDCGIYNCGPDGGEFLFRCNFQGNYQGPGAWLSNGGGTAFEFNDSGSKVFVRPQVTSIFFPACSQEGAIVYREGSAGGQIVGDGTDPFINNQSTVVFTAADGVYVWDDGTSHLLAPGASSPAINDLGVIAFVQNSALVHCESEASCSFASPIVSGLLVSDINNDGEVVAQAGVAGTNWILRRVRNGDVNLDMAVDAVDFAPLPECMTGPGNFDRLCTCRFFDMQFDRDVDLADIAQFQNTFYHPQYPGHECCNASHGPGCNDALVQNCVCAVAPDCCKIDWSENCTVLVELLNCGTCP